ncbi:MAG: carboxypeptidase-like regulatory domain-containing protein [Chitinophagaceae bacterium]|nr:carboxypeptidase-like regulatory domain-containing protein [Chitinophagaceae bacterium]MBP6588998.1 carboxypeptidase-like regulatory domain-containing protein [Chitinophagaceae bacterium]
MRLRYIILLLLSFLLFNADLDAQLYKVRGTVYDSSQHYPLEAVSVISTSGRGTVTNSEGNYEIDVAATDSIFFSYLGKPTMKFPILTIQNILQFNISLHVSIPTLKEVKIRPRNYRQDSIQNREDYAKVFNYQKPKLKTVTPQYGAGVGFDLDEIVNMFRFKRNRSIANFQKRLLQQEEDKFIDFRFSKSLVRRLTLLTGNELDSFMRLYRPSYTFTKFANDYDFQAYIKQAHLRFENGLPPLPFLKNEEEY